MEKNNDLLVSELERLADKPESLLAEQYWFPLGLYGLLSLMAGVVFTFWDPNETSSWLVWAILGPLGGVVTGLWFDKKSIKLGIDQKSPLPYVLIWGACFVCCSLSGVFLDPIWIFPAVLAFVGVGNICLGYIDNIVLMSVVGLGLISLGLLGGIGEIRADIFNVVVGVFMFGSSVLFKTSRPGAVRG